MVMLAGIEVPTETIESLDTGRSPDLIKIDAEGAELNILKGGLTVLEKRRPVIVVEFSEQRALEEARGLLRSHVFRQLGTQWNWIAEPSACMTAVAPLTNVPPGGLRRLAAVLTDSFAVSLAIQLLNVITGVLLARALGPTGRGELAAYSFCGRPCSRRSARSVLRRPRLTVPQ